MCVLWMLQLILPEGREPQEGKPLPPELQALLSSERRVAGRIVSLAPFHVRV